MRESDEDRDQGEDDQVNLPQYRRALSEAHERYREHLTKATQAYVQEAERAALELQEQMSAISHEFHEDAEEARAVRSEYPGEAELARAARR